MGVQARINDPLRSRFEACRLEQVFADCFGAELRTRYDTTVAAILETTGHSVLL